MLLAAAIALLVGLLAWGVFGSVSTRVSATAVRDRDSIRCFLAPSDVARVRPGNMAYVGNEQMEVAGVDVTPYSREEVSELLGRDYLTDAVMREDWTYLVVLKGDGDYDFIEGVPLSVAITTDRVAPITLVLDR